MMAPKWTMTGDFGAFSFIIVLLLSSPAISFADWQRQIISGHITLTPIARLAKNTRFFTQGLTVSGDTLYESNGKYGQSTLCHSKILDNRLATPSCKTIEDRYFAEGISIVNDSVFQLTWQENTLIEHDKNTLKTISTSHYQGQGWGLSNNSRVFIMSDGSDKIQLRRLDNFAIEKILPVRHNQKSVSKINELEWINGKLWANQWYSDAIYIVDLESGEVDAVIDFSHLLPQHLRPHSQAVLNGIGFDSVKSQLYITGKHWPYYYLFKLTDHTTD
jgi:glutamine cyclotransferase